MKVVVIIPARWESSRFPGKPLADIAGKGLLERVFNQSIQAYPNVYVATDDNRIYDHCKEKGMPCVMTGDCMTGTDRVAEAYMRLDSRYDVVVNVQGDEPLVKPGDIIKVAEADNQRGFPVPRCGMCKIKTKEDFDDPNTIKIIADNHNMLLYASRAGIPTNKKLEFISAYKQVCIYAFAPFYLEYFAEHKQTTFEVIEDIEILRVLGSGKDIQMVEVSEASIGVNVPSDIERVLERL